MSITQIACMAHEYAIRNENGTLSHGGSPNPQCHKCRKLTEMFESWRAAQGAVLPPAPAAAQPATDPDSRLRRLERALALHGTDAARCPECDYPAPCLTRRILSGLE